MPSDKLSDIKKQQLIDLCNKLLPEDCPMLEEEYLDKTKPFLEYVNSAKTLAALGVGIEPIILTVVRAGFALGHQAATIQLTSNQKEVVN